jgi:DmsE family decaheme c-type cytochrome
MRNIDLLVFCCGAAFFATGVASGQPALPKGYVGSEICQTCHEDIYNNFLKSQHWAIDSKAVHGFQGRSCEGCHGPAQTHTETGAAEDIRNPGKISAASADKVCLSCHLNQPTHIGRLTSSHMKDAVSCTACHKIHSTEPGGLVDRRAASVNKQCATCHNNVWSQFQKPFHHRLPEDAMSCIDCHNPHGSVRTSMTKTFGANEQPCLGCHGDKRGPFTFEHAALRYEGCNACHETHGSANPRMLTRQEVRYVCLECHANLPFPPTQNTKASIGVVPPSFHDLRSPRYQNCTVCHQKIHGSYVDRNLLR